MQSVKLNKSRSDTVILHFTLYILHSLMQRLARYTYNGVTLPLRGWAKRLGAAESALEARLIGGWSVQKTLETPIAPYERPKAPSVPYRPPKTSYILEGDGRFMTVKDWAKELGCARHVVYHCIRYNRPFKCRDGKSIEFIRHRAFEHGGVALRASEWAKRLNISCDEFLRRIKDGLGEADVFKECNEAQDI